MDGVVLDLFTLTSVSGTGTGFDSSPIKETFEKLSGTAIISLDFQSAKLDLAMDSRLRRNDGPMLDCLVVCPSASPLDCGSSPQ